MEFLVILSLSEYTSKPLSIKKPLFSKPFFIGARTFMRATKMGTLCAIYAILTFEEMTTSTSILL